MTRAEKRLEKLCRTPPPADLTWDELVSALGSLGFELDQGGGGSHCFFLLATDPDKVIGTYRPHPRPCVHRKEIKEIVQKLEQWEMI